MQTKRILVTGAAGFLGSWLAEWFIQNGHEVVGTDNLIGGDLKNVPKEVEFYTFDCNNFGAMKKITRDIDIVYHCAATAYEGLSVFSPAIVTKNCFQNTSTLLSASIANGVKRFVFTSSMARYGAKKAPFTEETEPAPEDPYGIAKYAAELLIKNLAETHGMEHVIAVPHNIIGPRQKYDDPYRNVAAIFINRMLQGNQPVIYGDGTQQRCFSFVQDCIQCLDKMAFQKNVVGEVINIGPDEGFVTVNALAKELAELMDFKLNPIYVDPRPREVKLAFCSSDKARKLLGYQTKYTLTQGLQEMIDWVQAAGPKPFEYHLGLEIVNDKTPKPWKDKTL